LIVDLDEGQPYMEIVSKISGWTLRWAQLTSSSGDDRVKVHDRCHTGHGEWPGGNKSNYKGPQHDFGHISAWVLDFFAKMGPTIATQEGVNRIANAQNECKAIAWPPGRVCGVAKNPGTGGIMISAAD
jgi:hypothetical protein